MLGLVGMVVSHQEPAIRREAARAIGVPGLAERAQGPYQQPNQRADRFVRGCPTRPECGSIAAVSTEGLLRLLVAFVFPVPFR